MYTRSMLCENTRKSLNLQKYGSGNFNLVVELLNESNNVVINFKLQIGKCFGSQIVCVT